MSNSSNRPSHRKSDRTAAVTLEVPPGVADDIEEVLRGYAEESELDTSLVVDHSGFLIAGISSLADVDVDTIGALVAGASGATEGLTGALGEEGRVESLHLGEDRLLYLKEIGERFILVGVSDSNIPAGILRDQASLAEPKLLKLLGKVKVVPMSLTKRPAAAGKSESEPASAPPKSLRQPDAKPAPAAPGRPKARPVASITKPEAVAGAKISGSIDSIPKTQKQVVEQISPPTPGKDPKDPIPDSVFEFDESDMAVADKKAGKSKPANPPVPIESKKVEPHAVVESSPFEMDEGEDGNSGFKPVRPKTTPVHLSVPAARKREAAARQEKEDDDDSQSGKHYSFELG